MGLFDIFSNDSAEKARDLANAGATKGYSDLSGMYDQGRSALTSNFGAASDLYKNLITNYTPGATAYGNVSGANGAAGSAKAYDDFLHSGAYGGFNFANDAGLQAIARQHAAAGNPSSGNADTDAAKFTTGLAGQTWNNYQAGLLPYMSGVGTATAGAAGVDQNLGTALNQSYQGQGGAANNTATTIGNNNAGAELNNYKVGANLWNGLMGGANLLAGGVGGAGGLTGGFGGTGFSLGPTSVGGAPVKGGLFSAFT